MADPRPDGLRRGLPTPALAPVAWGAAATARRETVAKESSAQAVSRIVSSCANSSGLAVAAVDANAAISGGAVLASTGHGARGGVRRRSTPEARAPANPRRDRRPNP